MKLLEQSETMQHTLTTISFYVEKHAILPYDLTIQVQVLFILVRKKYDWLLSNVSGNIKVYVPLEDAAKQ
jgi:hypothetical protein